MGGFIQIEHAAIYQALKDATRQYFVGNLSRPQVIDFIHDERLEIGISSYPSYTFEQPHCHSVATEYQYMISGWTEYMNLDSGEIFKFTTGDFYAIMPNTPYAQKVKAGTNILFIKVPSINDKALVELSPEQEMWLKTALQTVRVDYYYQANSPMPNSIKPAAAVAIVNDKHELLMLHRQDSQKWTMPGGTLEFGESLTDCALREVKEETGLDVRITDMVGTYTDPNILVAYSDGEVRQEFTIVYFGEALNSQVILDLESTEYKWVSLESVMQLSLANSQRRRLTDVIEYIKSGKRKFT